MLSAFFYSAHFGYEPVDSVVPGFMTFRWNQSKGGRSVSLIVAVLCMFEFLTSLGNIVFEERRSK